MPALSTAAVPISSLGLIGAIGATDHKSVAKRTAVVAFVSAILPLVLIRARDFVPPPPAPSAAESGQGLAQGAAQAG